MKQDSSLFPVLDRYIVENHGGIDSTLKILFENQISRGLYSRGIKSCRGA